MPSKSKQVTVKCDSCAKLFQVTHWYQVNGIENPDLKQRILDGSLFVAKCNHCGSFFKVEPSIRYSELLHQDRQTFAAYLVSPDQIENDRGYIETMPLFRRMGARIHVVTSSDELKQLIRDYDHGKLPPETVIKASSNPQENLKHDAGLDKMFGSINQLMKEVESGKLSPETAERIKRGAKLMTTNNKKRSAASEVLKDPKQSCVVLGALGCLLAIFDMPDSFYAALRFVVVAAAIAAVWILQKSNHGEVFKNVMSLLIGLLAIVFNPVLPLDMDKEQWTFFNLAGAGLLIGVLLRGTGSHAAKGAVSESKERIVLPKPLPDAEKFAPRQSAPPTTPVMSAGRATAPQKTSGKEDLGDSFHYVIETPLGQKPTLQNTLIKAEAFVKVNADGTRKYTLSHSPNADIFDMFQGHSAIYWKKQFDNKTISLDQAANMVDRLSKETSTNYWGNLKSDTEKTKELFLLAALTIASLHCAIVNGEKIGFPEGVLQWFQTKRADGKSWNKHNHFEQAEAFAAAQNLGLIDSELLRHLELSVR